MSNESDWKYYLLIIIGAITGLCLIGGLITLIIKLFQAIWKASFKIEDIVFDILNFVLNALGVILSILGPIVVILLLGYLIIFLFGKLSMKLGEIINQIKTPKGTNIAPIVIAGFLGLFVTVVKETTIHGDVKVLLLLALGTVTTILTMTTSQPKKTRGFGFLLLGVCVLAIMIFTSIRFDLFVPGQIQVIVNSINDWFVSFTCEQYVSMGIFITFLILMIIAAIHYRQKPQP